MENYRKETLTIDIVKANIYGLLLFIPIAIMFIFPYILIWSEQFSFAAIREFSKQLVETHFVVFFWGLLIFLGGIIIHELIHGIVFAIYAKGGFRSIRFGVMWKMLTPYCHCKEPLLVKHYILGAVMPAIMLGIIPAIASIIIGSFGLLLFGVFFTMAGIGDFMVIHLLRNEKMNDMVQDHPSEAGCYIFREEDAEKLRK